MHFGYSSEFREHASSKLSAQWLVASTEACYAVWDCLNTFTFSEVIY
jgi:hypothetical protein